MAETLSHCPNCGYPVKPDGKLCPYCGFVSSAMPSPLRTLTGRVWLDLLLGAAGQYLTHLSTAQLLVRWAGLLTPSQDDLGNYFAPGFLDIAEGFWALVFGLGIYYGLRRFYPILARGSGYMSIALLTVLGGALFSCRPMRY